MGPRERKIIELHAGGVPASGSGVRKAQLADALEEALDGWAYATDALIDLYPNSAKEGRAVIRRLRALLSEPR